MTAATISYTVRDAAASTGISEDMIRRAIRKTAADDESRPLPAKKNGARLLILADDLREWVRSLPDA